jgi:PAS domain S-box-containing protein
MPTQPTTILVVDDKEGTRYTVARLLQRSQYAVREAGTGADALRLAAEKPDLIILDVNLPDVSGYEICRRVKADPATSSIPVLHLSATFVESENRATGLEGGADGYLTYPIEPRELIASIEALLRARRAEKAAREQHELLRVTLNSIGDAVIATDAEGRVTFLNPVAQGLIGWPAEEAEGRPLTQVFRVVNERTRQAMEDPVAHALREGRIVGLANHTLLQARDGTERPIEDSAAPIHDADGRAVGVVLVFRDVSGRRAAERALRESQDRLRLMVESVKDYAIFAVDANGIVTNWNTGAERVFGYTEEEMVGRTADVLWGEVDRAEGVPERERARAVAAGRAEDERWHVRKGGSRFYASGVVTPILDESGRVRGFTKVARDVTDRKRAEEALQEADRRKDVFLAMLAHELRNPLAPIANALHLVRLQGGDARPALDVIERQVEHMVRLVDDLLDVSRITRGQIKLQKKQVDLAVVISRAVESSRPLIEARRHTLDVRLPDGPLPVEGDQVRLAQVILNLLINAAKYTPEGGQIWLTVEREPGAAGSPGQAVVRVRDTGMGIPAEMLAGIFDLFTQVERTLDRAEGGLGIGLSLVRSLTELHGGSVEVRSEGPGQGSEFAVRLPLAVGARGLVAPEQAAEENKAAASSPGRRILVVDDVRDSADSLATLLRLFGNDVRTAYEGRQALAVAAAYRPDLVLLDLGLPGMNGYEVARQLRALPAQGERILVALTGFGTEEDRRQTRDAGFDYHLVKPVDLEALQHLLSSLAPQP